MHDQHVGLHWHMVVHHEDKILALFSFVFAMNTVLKSHISTEIQHQNIVLLMYSNKLKTESYIKNRRVKYVLIFSFSNLMYHLINGCCAVFKVKNNLFNNY